MTTDISKISSSFKLEQQIDNYEKVQDELPLGLISFDSKGNIFQVNRFLMELLGSPSAESAKNINMLTFPPLVESGISKSIQDAISSGEKTIIEAPYRSRWGKDLFLHFKTIPYKDSTGSVTGCHAIIEDATADIETKCQLKEKEAEYEEVINAIDTIIWKADADQEGNLVRTYISSSADKILELPTGSIDNDWNKYFSYIHPEDLQNVQDILQHGFQNPGSFFDVDYRLMKDDGGIIWVNSDGIVHALPDGNLRVFGTSTNITGRKIAEEALRESESSVQRKLNAIMEPDGDIGELELADIIDHEALQSLMDDFYQLTRIGVGIIDLKGEVLVGTGWQDICTKFHRVNPDTCRHCVESDLELSKGVEPGTFKLYKCKNNMWDIATPVMIGNSHVGNLFLGQFFFDDEEIDFDSFRLQAKKYGFDESKYLEALEQVPRWSRETVDTIMSFYMQLTDIISTLSYGNLNLARTLNERDELLTSLHESESRFRSYMEQAPEGMFIVNEKGNFVEVNEAASSIASYTKEEMVGMHLTELVSPEDKEKSLAHFQAISKNGSAIDDFHVLSRDGIKRVCTVKAVKLSETRFLGFASDITYRKRAEEAMLNAKIEAEAANKMKSEFLTNMSHELRTPLNSVIGFSDMLLEGHGGDLEKKQKKYVGNVAESGKYLLDLINNILDIAKIESGKMQLEPEHVPLKELCSDVENLIGHLAIKKDIELNINDHEDIRIYGDRIKVKQIIYNLLSNAIKFTPEKGEVSLSATLVDDDIQISVKDTGIGIAEEDYDKLFKPFKQIESSLSRQYVGTGLGLSIARELVELHGGNIWVESDVGKGSTFTFMIPMRAPANT